MDLRRMREWLLAGYRPEPPEPKGPMNDAQDAHQKIREASHAVTNATMILQSQSTALSKDILKNVNVLESFVKDMHGAFR